MEFKTEKSAHDIVVEGISIMNHDDFMIFEVLDTGERQRLNITEEEFTKSKGAGIFHPKQVVIIVLMRQRRIYIWKGSEPHIRKKFIASRVAQELQGELIKRCKIVTVDQGDELTEFLNAFVFDRNELAKITGFNGQVNNQMIPKFTRQTPTTAPISNKIRNEFKTIPSNTKKAKIENSGKTISEELLKEILNKDPPENFKRKTILIGQNTLYSLTTKKVRVFGQDLEESEWEPVTNLPGEVFELDGRKLRIHHNEIEGIKAIEILEPIIEDKKLEPIKQKEFTEERKIDYNKWTVKQLKAFCNRNGIKVPSSFRKAQLIKLVEDFVNE